MNPIAVLIPAYQEEETITQVVSRARYHVPRVLVVNDGSTDHTAALAKQAGAEVLSNERNLGKGISLRVGLEHFLREGCEYIIMMDGDLQHLPEEIPSFVKAAGEEAAIVLGARQNKYEHMPYQRQFSNALTSWIISKLTGQHIPDTQCGFRMIRADVAGLILRKCSSKSFDFESEMLLVAAQGGYKIRSIPVSTVYGSERSKINVPVETLRFIRLFWRYTPIPRRRRAASRTP